MWGTLVNTGAILAGSLIGAVLRRGLAEKYQLALYNAMGFAALMLGINSVVSRLPQSRFPVLFILSLAAGGVIGTWWDLDGRFQRLAGRFSRSGSSRLGEGLSTAVLLFCIGTLSILGPINSALLHDHTFLFTNATLDFVTSIVLASTYGIGIAAAAAALFLWQGGIYLCATLLSPYLNEGLLTEVTIVGGVLIASSGLAILKLKDARTMNMLPALAVPVVWYAAAGLL